MLIPVCNDANKKDRIEVKARPGGLWSLALDTVQGGKRVAIRVCGDNPSWQFGENGESCGPAGSRNPGTNCLCPGAPKGALIGKIGGSDCDDTSVALPAAGGTPGPIVLPVVFPVGGVCVVEIKDDVKGPLFLTMNDAPSNFKSHEGSVQVLIELIA